MKTKNKADLCLLLITVFWASAAPLNKIALAELDVFNLLAIRFVFAFIILAVFFHRQLVNADAATWRWSFYLSVVTLFTYLSGTLGVRYTTASNAGFLTSLSAILVPLLAFLLYRKKPGKKILLGAMIATAGIGLLTIKNGLSVNPGDILCLACSLIYAWYIILVQKTVGKVEPIALSILQLGFIGVYSLAGTLLLEKPHLPSSTVAWLSVLSLTVLCTAATMIIQTMAQQYTPAEDAAVILSTQPVFTAFFAFLLAGEILGLQEYAGAFIIFAGVMLAVLRPQNNHITR